MNRIFFFLTLSHFSSMIVAYDSELNKEAIKTLWGIVSLAAASDLSVELIDECIQVYKPKLNNGDYFDLCHYLEAEYKDYRNEFNPKVFDNFYINEKEKEFASFKNEAIEKLRKILC